jgi:hypothetical protein
VRNDARAAKEGLQGQGGFVIYFGSGLSPLLPYIHISSLLFLPRPISFQSQVIKALFLSSNYFLSQSFQQSPLYSIQESAIAIATIFATDRTKCQSGQTFGSFVIERAFIKIPLVEHNGSLR